MAGYFCVHNATFKSKQAALGLEILAMLAKPQACNDGGIDINFPHDQAHGLE